MPSCRSAVASVTGWASASHCSARLEVGVAAVAQRQRGQPAGDRRGRGDPGGGLEHAVEERLRGQHAGDQAEPERLVGVDRAAGEQQVAGVRRADDVGQQVRRRHPGVHARAARTARRAGHPAAAYRRSQASARHSPAPIAGPLTAAIVGTSSRRIDSQAR